MHECTKCTFYCPIASPLIFFNRTRSGRFRRRTFVFVKFTSENKKSAIVTRLAPSSVNKNIAVVAFLFKFRTGIARPTDGNNGITVVKTRDRKIRLKVPWTSWRSDRLHKVNVTGNERNFGWELPITCETTIIKRVKSFFGRNFPWKTTNSSRETQSQKSDKKIRVYNLFF